MKKQYVGITRTGQYVAFRTIDNPPTPQSTTFSYIAVIGPFKTRRAALWAERYGRGNPHFQTVADAERLALL